MSFSREAKSPYVTRSLIVTAGLLAAVGGTATGANAIPGQTSEGSTTATVEVGSSITLTALPASFTLSGNPGDLDSTTTPPVTYTVTTNNAEGYSVTVEPVTATLTGALPGNTDTIPVGLLGVRDSGLTTTYDPLISGTPVVVHTQSRPSAEDGDDLGTEFQITIPFVTPDTYTVELDYVATTL